MNKVICYFHSRDLDGCCSGAIVKKKYPDCELYGIDYGEEFPWNKAKEYPLAFMVDFSLPIEDMAKLNKITELVWIDHHISAIKDYDKHLDLMEEYELNEKTEIQGIREVGKAGCELTWEYLFSDKKTPEAVRLLGSYDTWRYVNSGKEEDIDVLPFQMGARMEDLEPASEMWDVLLISNDLQATFHINQLTEKGKTILDYQDSQNTMTCKSNAFEVNFEGLN